MVKVFFSRIWEVMKQRTIELEEHLTTLGVFLLVSFPSFYYINLILATREIYENPSMRLSIGAGGLLLILRHHWPRNLKFLTPLVVYGLLFYAFSFFYFFMTFENDFSTATEVNVFLGLFVLLLFLSWQETIIMGVVGFFLSWFIVSQLTYTPELPDTFWNVTVTYISLFVYIILFSTKKEHIQSETLRTLKTLAGAIAHEVRTPLFGITTEARWLKKVLPSLISAYDIAEKSGDKNLPVLTPAQLKLISQMPDNLESTTRDAFIIIDIFLMNLKEVTLDKDQEICSITECIDSALTSYPLTDDERELIKTTNTIDFTFKGNSLLIKHVLYNLLKNALYQIKDAQKGEISIWLEGNNPFFNKLHFKDTGKGIPQHMLPHIFERFYTKTKYGTGIGLAFCKMVMEGIGGDIICQSVEGEYAEFILLFPAIDSYSNSMIP